MEECPAWIMLRFYRGHDGCFSGSRRWCNTHPPYDRRAWYKPTCRTWYFSRCRCVYRINWCSFIRNERGHCQSIYCAIDKYSRSGHGKNFFAICASSEIRKAEMVLCAILGFCFASAAGSTTFSAAAVVRRASDGRDGSKSSKWFHNHPAGTCHWNRHWSRRRRWRHHNGARNDNIAGLCTENGARNSSSGLHCSIHSIRNHVHSIRKRRAFPALWNPPWCFCWVALWSEYRCPVPGWFPTSVLRFFASTLGLAHAVFYEKTGSDSRGRRRQRDLET
mmetsp:Transcript_10778/g.15555  ORF Transcript_10778/g.15555 Transcript_10778/m.15555 type:complete len:277 (+) Transcript_10778:356-1186(+)